MNYILIKFLWVVWKTKIFTLCRNYFQLNYLLSNFLCRYILVYLWAAIFNVFKAYCKIKDRYVQRNNCVNNFSFAWISRNTIERRSRNFAPITLLLANELLNGFSLHFLFLFFFPLSDHECFNQGKLEQFFFFSSTTWQKPSSVCPVEDSLMCRKFN